MKYTDLSELEYQIRKWYTANNMPLEGLDYLSKTIPNHTLPILQQHGPLVKESWC